MTRSTPSSKTINKATQDATQKQRMASNPIVSSWVGASAGSGKTKVLTDRILRLLLPRENGEPATRPEKILALTFTKAAANEMSLRLSSRLSDWAVISDEKLKSDMEENLLGRPPTQEELIAARQLFARVIDTPGGLNIMTIHSFCQSVLGRFPIEADLPPNFKPLEEGDAKRLLKDSIKSILSHASNKPNTPLYNAVARMGALVGEDKFYALMTNIVEERYQVQDILKKTFGVEGLYTQLCQYMGVQAGTDKHTLLQSVCTLTPLQELDLRHSCAVLSQSTTKKSPLFSLRIQKFLDNPLEKRMSNLSDYISVFLTNEGTIRDGLAPNDVKAKDPNAENILRTEGERLQNYVDLCKRIDCTQSTHDVFLVGVDVIKEYQNLKHQLGALDFNDLIFNTLSLLKGEGKIINNLGDKTTQWVMFKMDGGLEHILVDEAQDTNPEQWEIIDLLASEFFNGKDASNATRTLFVVGDEKQSIFGFQRAAPEKFVTMEKHFQKLITNSGHTFISVDINTSFRSSQTILDSVDCVFTQGDAGAAFKDHYQNHMANREGQAGIVELWPLLKTKSPDDNKKEERKEGNDDTGWDIPNVPMESRSGSLQMAQKIGDTIEDWIKNKTILESYGREIHPGDILILVRARNAFVNQLVRTLKAKNIAVSGIDRMVLRDQLVVQDLCAAASFGLLPEDDLNLACFLKSPFIGLDEDHLYTLCRAQEKSLWDALRKSEYSEITSWLEKLILRASKLTPYAFFATLIQEACPANKTSGLQAVRARLGEDSTDPMDEFLNMSLNFEQEHTATLQSFLKWHHSGSSDIKRELQEGGGAVRIMTVHGAKGLQAPIVFLPDTVRSQSGKSDDIFWPEKTRANLPVFATSIKDMPSDVLSLKQKLQDKADSEYRRLLYVAMTRAEERLYIGGYFGKRGPAKEGSKVASWYNDVKSAFENHPQIQSVVSKTADAVDDITLILEGKRTAEPDKKDKADKNVYPFDLNVPSWATKSAPQEPFPPKPLIPSRPSEEEPAAISPLSQNNENQHHFKRGVVTHKALQILPDIDPKQRLATLTKFLSIPAHGLSQDIQKSISNEVMAILNDPVFGKIFGPGSLAEVPLTGLIDNKSLIAGQVDRLLVTANEVLVVDFKTNRPPPENIKDVPNAYIRQMALYAKALAQIYPKHTIRTALLWTQTAQLMEVNFQ